MIASMRPCSLWLILCLVLACAGASRSAAQEWRPLFNGKNLDGWQGDSRFWSVRDGVLVGESTTEKPLHQTTWLSWTGGMVRDFELVAEFRLSGGNSGIQFRSEQRPDHQVAGLQADLEDGPDWTGCIYEQEGRGVLVRRGTALTTRSGGSPRAQVIADGRQLLESYRSRDWNEYRILAQGRRIEIKLNGTLMSSLEDHDAQHFRESGILALQLHSGPPMRVEFRRLDLKTLAPLALSEESRSATPPAPSSLPQWIWSSPASAIEASALASVRFTKRFTLREASALKLWVSVDNAGEVLLDGRKLGETSDWATPVYFAPEQPLEAGQHELVVIASNHGGPAGLLVEADLQGPQEKQTLRSDATWQWEDGRQQKPVTVLGEYGCAPWGKLEGLGSRPPEATPAHEMHVKEGYRIERLYSVPRSTQGSWVSLAYDGSDRLYASDQYGDVHRIQLAAEHDRVLKVDKLPAPIGGAHGLLWTANALYAVVAESPRCETGLWRVTDKDGDGELEHAELLKKFAGSGEHGPHSVIQGPDGLLYVLAGNHTLLPEGLRTYYRPRSWAEDQLVKHRNDPGGHAVGVMAPGGWVCRTDLDGKHWDLFAAGMRNSYDLAFVGLRDLFTFDSDMEWDIGLPWYRPTRVLQLVSGADFGWRNGNAKWKDYFPDSLPSVKDLGLGSPTGVVAPPPGFAPEGSKDGAPHLLAGDWAYGRIFALWLEPEGSTFRAKRTEIFASGRPMPVADMALGRSDEVFFVTGGRRVQSGLYRISCAATPQALDPQSDRLPASFDRQLRMDVEAFHAKADEQALGIIWPKLSASDRFVRNAARVALEAQPRSQWEERAFQETNLRAIVQCMLALIHLDARDIQNRILERLGDALRVCRDDNSSMEALRAVQVAMARWGVQPHGSLELMHVVDSLFPLPPERGKLSNPLLAELNILSVTPLAWERTLHLMERSPTPEEQLTYMSLLAESPENLSYEERVRYLRWWRSNAAHWKGGNSYGKYIASIHEDIVNAIPPQEQALMSELLTPEPRSTPVPIPAAGQSVPWTVSEIESSLDQLKSGRSHGIGKELYTRTSCIECHRMGSEGGGQGPDLTGAGARFSARDLLVAVLEPSQMISDQYRETEVITRDEELLVGKLAGGDDQVLRLVDRQGKTIEIPRSEIAEQRPARLSSMPASLTDGLTRTELLDLLAYVLAGGDPADPAFRPDSK
jgi:putative heme-binding domain-containing protein